MATPEVAFVAPQYTSVDLPIWSPQERPLWDTDRLHSEPIIPDDGSETIIRAIRLDMSAYTHNNDLADLLARAEIEFDKISKFCGASVVAHTWGLYRVTPQELSQKHPFTRRSHHEQAAFKIPPEFLLAAEVAYIHKGQPISTLSRRTDLALIRQINRGVRHYKSLSASFFLHDTDARQFLKHPDPDAPGQSKATLVDIDLLFDRR